MAPSCTCDGAVAPRPQAGDRAHQRALAGAGLARDQHPLARAIAISASLTTAVPSSSVTDRSRSRSAAPVVSPRSMRREAFGRPRAFSRPSSETISEATRERRRGPVGEPRIVVDQPVERALHDGEGRRRLHDLAQRHRAVEEFRRAQDDRQHRRDVAAGLRHDRRAHGLDADVAPARAAPCRRSGRRRCAPRLRRRAPRCSRRSRAAASARSGTPPRPGSCSPTR